MTAPLPLRGHLAARNDLPTALAYLSRVVRTTRLVPVQLRSQAERAECAPLRQDERENHRMTDEQSQMPSPGNQSVSTSYSAEVGEDLALRTTTISLSSTDQSNSSRNTLVCIALEFGSKLFRFRVG